MPAISDFAFRNLQSAMDELYILSRHNDPLTTRHAGLDDDRISFDPAMTDQEGLEQRGTGVSPVEGHGQDAHATSSAPIPSLRLCVFARDLPFFHFLSARRQGRQGVGPGRPGACDLLDASRLWNNPVHADGVIIPSK